MMAGDRDEVLILLREEVVHLRAITSQLAQEISAFRMWMESNDTKDRPATLRRIGNLEEEQDQLRTLVWRIAVVLGSVIGGVELASILGGG